MAIITPYGDPNAHGSIGNSLTFRRRFGKVILEKKPYPKQPNSSAQIAQRTAFGNAQKAWYSLTQVSKDFYNTRGAQYGWNGINLYIYASLNGLLPSSTPIALKEITALDIITPVCGAGESVRFKFTQLSPSSERARIDDPTENASYYGANTPARAVVIQTERLSGTTIDFPFRYGITMTWKDGADVVSVYNVRFPAFQQYIPIWQFYMSADGSLYKDISLTELYCTDNF